MRSLATCLLLLAATAVAALETPLILRPQSGAGDQMIVVNPSLGTLQLYRSNIQQLEQVDTGNFLADLDYISKLPVPGKMEWSVMRTGSAGCLPSYGQMFDEILPAMSRATRAKRGEEQPLTLAERALNSENEFWEKAPEYDGIVSGAALANSFVLVIPSSYTLLYYTIENQTIDLAGWRNYRGDMYIPQVYQSRPTPQELLSALPPEVQAERKEQMQQQMEEMGEAAGKVIALQPSEPWIGASETSGQVYVLVDPANKRLMAYQLTSRGKQQGLIMQSVRNLEIDLMIPTVFNSVPNNADLIGRYNKHLTKAGLPPVTREEIEQLATRGAVTNDKASSFQAVIDQAGVLQLDFQSQRQLTTYRLSAQGVDLIAARNYTLETGIGLHRQNLVKMNRAASMDKLIEGAVKAKEFEGAMHLLEIALEWNPWLYKDFAKSRTVNRLEKEMPQEWVALIDKAMAEVERREAERQKLIEAAEAARKARDDRKGR